MKFDLTESECNWLLGRLFQLGAKSSEAAAAAPTIEKPKLGRPKFPPGDDGLVILSPDHLSKLGVLAMGRGKRCKEVVEELIDAAWMDLDKGL